MELQCEILELGAVYLNNMSGYVFPCGHPDDDLVGQDCDNNGCMVFVILNMGTQSRALPAGVEDADTSRFICPPVVKSRGFRDMLLKVEF
jgi:hypothetical protein